MTKKQTKTKTKVSKSKKPIREEQVVAKYLRVNNRSYSDSQHSSEPYGDWSEDITNNIRGIKLVSHDEMYDVIADFDVQVGENVFLVYATYSWGDSFGHGSGRMSYVGIWKDRTKAQAAVAEIRRSRKAYDEDKNMGGWSSNKKHPFAATFISESGKEIVDSFPSWCGYFEGLESAEMIELTVQ